MLGSLGNILLLSSSWRSCHHGQSQLTLRGTAVATATLQGEATGMNNQRQQASEVTPV